MKTQSLKQFKQRHELTNAQIGKMWNIAPNSVPRLARQGVNVTTSQDDTRHVIEIDKYVFNGDIEEFKTNWGNK